MSLNRYFAVQYVIDMPGASAAKYSARNARKITSAVENIVLDVSDDKTNPSSDLKQPSR